jgi:hypothetical protein
MHKPMEKSQVSASFTEFPVPLPWLSCLGIFGLTICITGSLLVPLEAKMEPTDIRLVCSLMLILNKQQLSTGPINIGLTGRPTFLAQKLILQKAYIYHRQQEKQQMKSIKNFNF